MPRRIGPHHASPAGPADGRRRDESDDPDRRPAASSNRPAIQGRRESTGSSAGRRDQRPDRFVAAPGSARADGRRAGHRERLRRPPAGSVPYDAGERPRERDDPGDVAGRGDASATAPARPAGITESQAQPTVATTEGDRREDGQRDDLEHVSGPVGRPPAGGRRPSTHRPEAPATRAAVAGTREGRGGCSHARRGRRATGRARRDARAAGHPAGPRPRRRTARATRRGRCAEAGLGSDVRITFSTSRRDHPGCPSAIGSGPSVMCDVSTVKSTPCRRRP